MIMVIKVDAHPKIVFEAWPQQAQLWAQGQISKGPLTHWKELGYISWCAFMQTTKHGGAIVINRLIVVRYRAAEVDHWVWPKEACDVVWPMSNLLTPPGLVKTWYEKTRAGTPVAETDPMPSRSGALIHTTQGT